MKNNKSESVAIKRRKLLIGASTGTIAAWSAPIVSTIMMPAHAQTSPGLPPEELCSMIVTGNAVFGPISGTAAVPVCSLTFDILSGTAGAPLTIIDISNNDLPVNNTVTYDTFGVATDTTGPRVVWQGPASDAPFCSDLMPIDQNDITFTVTATCDAASGEEFTQMFTLAQVLA